MSKSKYSQLAVPKQLHEKLKRMAKENNRTLIGQLTELLKVSNETIDKHPA